MSWLYRLFKRSTDEGNVTLTGSFTATGAVAGASVSDAVGPMPRFLASTPQSIDFSGSDAATVLIADIPVDATIHRAWYIITTATLAAMKGAKIQIGVVDADATSNADPDAYVTGTAADSGLIVGAKPIGTVQPLTLAATKIPAGKILTASHVKATAGTDGKCVVVVEYSLA